MDWNGFKGAAKRLDDIDLPIIGAEIGVGEDEIHAVMDVEAAGSGFDSKGRPRILFERHHFYRRVSDANREKAIKAGLAVKRWSRATYGKDQHQLLARAMEIEPEAAILSCSWGLGQIMGWNHKLSGYVTVAAMVKAFMEDEEHHLRAMITFIKNAGLDDELRRHDWAGFARGYNGSGYKANRYDEKLAASFAKWSRIKNTPIPKAKPTPKPVEDVVKDAARSGASSTTNIATGVGAASSTIAIVKEATDAAKESVDGVSAILAAGPWVLLLVVALGAGWWIWRERQRKAKMAQAAKAVM